jgi:hypothetical protein
MPLPHAVVETRIHIQLPLDAELSPCRVCCLRDRVRAWSVRMRDEDSLASLIGPAWSWVWVVMYQWEGFDLHHTTLIRLSD